jgi:hypothetical protein
MINNIITFLMCYVLNLNYFILYIVKTNKHVEFILQLSEEYGL